MVDNELLTRVRSWAQGLPPSLCASFNPDLETDWVLRGASEDVYQQVNTHAKLLCPDAENALTALMYRIVKTSESVNTSEHLFEEHKGDVVIRSTRTTYRLELLGEALVEYCDYLSTGGDSQDQNQTSSGMKDSEAVKSNRKREAQQEIIAALQRLGFACDQWPAYVQSPDCPEISQTFEIAPFQPPPFEGLHQSVDDWKRKAREAFEKYLANRVSSIQFWIASGVEVGSSDAVRTRGPGETGRNSDLVSRYEWAARRIMGEQWKEIAGAAFQPDQVRKKASEILQIAEWSPDSGSAT